MKALFLFLLMLFFQSGSLIQEKIKDTTQLVSMPDEKADPAHNIVYTPAFSAAWTMLREDIVKEDIKLKSPVTIVPQLNKNLFKPSSEKIWVVCAGFVGDGIIDEIKKSMKSKFNLTINDLDEFSGKKDAIICYAHLQETMKFIVPFETMKWKFGTTIVSCFGVTKSTEKDEKDLIRKQVMIYDYKNPDDFIAVITGSDPAMEIILAKMEFQSSLRYMKDLIYDRIKQTFGDGVAGHDELIIPKINLSAFHGYDELLGKHLANKGFEEYFFVRADHKVNFKMDESGAIAEATGTIVKMKGPVPRIYAFDKPFLLILRNRGITEPSLIVWVAGTECLVKSD